MGVYCLFGVSFYHPFVPPVHNNARARTCLRVNAPLIPMISLNDRLLVAEEEFLSALDGGGQSISAFNVRWDKLLVDLDDAAASGEMDPELSHLAYNAAMRLSALADTSIELYNSYDAVTSRLMDQVESLMEELTISDVSRSRRADIPSTW